MVDIDVALGLLAFCGMLIGLMAHSAGSASGYERGFKDCEAIWRREASHDQ